MTAAIDLEANPLGMLSNWQIQKVQNMVRCFLGHSLLCSSIFKD